MNEHKDCSAGTAEAFTPNDAWDELVNKDDRTSPEEYPEMCLISFEELKDYMERYVPDAAQGATWPQPIATAPKDGTEFIGHENGDVYKCCWRTEEPDEGPGHSGWWDFSNQSFENPTEWSPLRYPAPGRCSAGTAESIRQKLNEPSMCFRMDVCKSSPCACAEELAGMITGPQEALKPPAPEPRRWPEKGDRMKFLGENGYPFELEDAKKIFTVGNTYEVHDCEVGSFDHRVQFVGVKGRFNGVMFELCSVTRPHQP